MIFGERVSYAVKMVVSHALYYGGALHLLRRLLLRRKVVVLMYHRVLTPEQRSQTASQPGMVVEDSTFARQMAVLKRHFTVLTLDEFAEGLESRVPFDGPCCLITFDDGWIDNAENAVPVLREHGLPSVVFLPVNFIGARRLFTREALTHLLVRAVRDSRTDPARRETLQTLLSPLGLEAVLDIPDDDPLEAAIDAVRSYRYASGPEFEAVTAALCHELGVSETGLSELDTFVDWAEVDSMTQAGVAFGGHGADHRVLAQVPPDVVRYEVETSKRVLDARLRGRVYAFAYPNGAWNAAVAAVVREAGYRLAFTIEPGPVSYRDDLFALRRVSIHEDMTRSTPMFLARLTGVL